MLIGLILAVLFFVLFLRFVGKQLGTRESMRNPKHVKPPQAKSSDSGSYALTDGELAELGVSRPVPASKRAAA